MCMSFSTSAESNILRSHSTVGPVAQTDAAHSTTVRLEWMEGGMAEGRSG